MEIMTIIMGMAFLLSFTVLVFSEKEKLIIRYGFISIIYLMLTMFHAVY